MLDTILLRRKYTIADQKAFALLSGDYNPLHLDPVIARRTMLGNTAVHGLNLAMTALEAVLARLPEKEKQPLSINKVCAQFWNPVFTGQKVCFQLTEQTTAACRVSGYVGSTAAFQVEIQFGVQHSNPPEAVIPPTTSETLVDANFDSLKEARGHLALALNVPLASQLFPRTLMRLGPTAMAEMLALTRLIGMRCPGLHSLFGQFDVLFKPTEAANSLQYQVIKADTRFRRLVIQVNGSRLRGTAQAFVPPPPKLQPETNTVSHSIPAGSFSESIALIVGGSRGIGEITAKIIAAGGGLPIITYYQGLADAEKVANDIREWGGRCEILQLDVRRGSPAVRRLFRGKNRPRSLYYFATPKIGGRRREFFNYETLDDFNEYYVKGFVRLIDATRSANSKSLRVFYPSSTAVDDTTLELAEYSMSKRMAEDLCAIYNRHSTDVEIIVERLPPIKTDQNISLLPIPSEDALHVMLPIVQRIERFS